MGFSQYQKIPEPSVLGMYHYVFIKERYLIFDTRKEMIKYYSDKIDKPKIYSPWKDTVFKGTNHIGRCACDCRHKARFICRQHKGNISVISVNGDKRQKLQ